jgi:hypothetical protein
MSVFISIPNELQTSSDNNACLAQLSSMMCMTIVQNCNRLEHFIDLQDDSADLQNHLEYLVDLQDDYINLQNDRRINAVSLPKYINNPHCM